MPRILLGMLAVGAALVFFLSARPWSATSMPRVAAVAALPQTAAIDAIVRESYTGIVLPYMEGERVQRSVRGLAGSPERRLGYAYREVSILKMPLWADVDHGFVVYRELPDGYSIMPLSAEQLSRLEAATGSSYSSYIFPVWWHVWGWLFAVGFVVWLILQRRAEAEWDEQPETI